MGARQIDHVSTLPIMHDNIARGSRLYTEHRFRHASSFFGILLHTSRNINYLQITIFLNPHALTSGLVMVATTA
jgi:hypothetical protein